MELFECDEVVAKLLLVATNKDNAFVKMYGENSMSLVIAFFEGDTLVAIRVVTIHADGRILSITDYGKAAGRETSPRDLAQRLSGCLDKPKLHTNFLTA